jgi:hypothetical protein
MSPDPGQPPTYTPTAGGQPPMPIVINTSPPQAPPPAPPSYSQAEFDAMREAVRKEEKDKLYPTIEGLQQEVKTLTVDLESRQAAEQAAQQRAADDERARQEAEMSALEQFQRAQEQRDSEMATLKEDIERERVLRQRESDLIELERYRVQRISEEADNISPDLVQFVAGSTQEQIEQSIARVKQSSAAIVAQTQEVLTRAGLPQPGYPQGQGLPVPGQQQIIPGLPVTGAPPIDMAAQMTNGQRTLSAQEIRDMPMDEYRQYRDQILNAGSQRVRAYGPYAP